MIFPAGYPRCVLMTADTVGGVWHYALELCRELGAHQVAVVLATMGPRADPEQRAAVSRLTHVTLCESDYRLEWMEDPWDDVTRAGEWLLGLEQQFTPEIIHLNGYAHAALPWRAPKLVVAHSCVLSWWESVRGGSAPPQWDRYRAAITAGLNAADLVVAPSRAMLAALARHYGRLPTSLVIPNGRADRESPPPLKEPFILSVGRLWDEAKNATTLADIAADLSWPVRVAGDTISPDGRRCALPSVEALGRCSPARLARFYARAAIYALPARYEPFGLSVLEAAQAGCALVLGDITSLRENWRDAALFVPPNDRARLRAALEELIHDDALRHSLGLAAQRRALTFSAAQMGARTVAAYRRLLNAAAAAPVRATLFA